MKKVLAVAICLLCAFALAGEAGILKEKIITTDPADGKKIEWSWSVSGELIAQKTLGYTNMPGGFRAENISFHTYGKPTRSVALADAVEMVITGNKIPVFVQGDKRISSFFQLKQKEEDFSVAAFYSRQKFQEIPLSKISIKKSSRDLLLPVMIGWAVITIFLFAHIIKKIALTDHEKYALRRAKFLFILLIITSLFLSFTALPPTQYEPPLLILSLLIFTGFLQALISALIFFLFAQEMILWKSAIIMGAVLAPANILTSAAAWQYAGFLALCYAFAFFFVKSISPFLKSLWIKTVSEFKH